MSKYPFEDSYENILAAPDAYVDVVFSCLESEFMVMPKGAGFVDYPVFERGYEALKAATDGFSALDAAKMTDVVINEPISLVVLRAMLGLTPPEWAYVASQQAGVDISQSFLRALDRKVRLSPNVPLARDGNAFPRVESLVQTACILLTDGPPQTRLDQLHRLDKADTRNGTTSMSNAAALGIPYAMLLYERFLGRPFAGHRDSVSDLIGDGLETAIETVLTNARISFRKTKRAAKIEGFDQAPDFIIPSEFNPQVVIEAKITEDDGTARDKVTRIQHLGELSLAAGTADAPGYEVVACIGGRGFGVRRADMRKMLLATRGKVFTLKTLEHLVSHTRLQEFASR